MVNVFSFPSWKASLASLTTTKQTRVCICLCKAQSFCTGQILQLDFFRPIFYLELDPCTNAWVSLPNPTLFSSPLLSVSLCLSFSVIASIRSWKASPTSTSMTLCTGTSRWVMPSLWQHANTGACVIPTLLLLAALWRHLHTLRLVLATLNTVWTLENMYALWLC